MEIFDVVDEKDNVVGQASRDECHSDPNLIHHTCQFTLIDRENRKILLTQRSFQKEHDSGKICFLGEHMLTGESYEGGVKRGILEELNFESEGKVREVAYNIFRYDKQTELVRFFLVDWKGEKIEFDKHEMEKIFWIDFADIKNLKTDYSTMTRFWVNKVDWAAI